MLPLRGDHLKFPNERVYTLLTSDPAADTATVIELQSRTALPEIVSYRWVTENAQGANSGQIQLLPTVASQFPSPASMALRARAWSLIEPLVADPLIFERGLRWKIVSKRATEVGCSPTTLISHLRRFWQGGQTQDALLGNLKNCGKFDGLTQSGRGRPSQKPGSANYYATPLDLENYRKIIEDFYFIDERKTIPDAVQALYEKFYSYFDGNGIRKIKPAGERPTQRQFERYLRKKYPVEMRMRARRGDKAFERDHRPVLGTIAQTCLGVGHIYEMDATIVDVTLVSSLNRADIIGRPTLYYIIDRESRLITGWYLGLENPCWSAALQAIFSIADDKEALCARLNIPFDPEDWPAHGVMPEQLYVDRGEAMGREATKLCTALATTVTNLPSCRPDWKPLVEGSFALIHRSIADTVPGYNPASNARKRRATDFGLEAALTLQELETILVKALIAHNRIVMERYPMSRSQLADHVQPSPINLWNHGIVSRSGHLARYSPDALRLALLSSDSATIDERGIQINHCFYMPESVDRRSWFVEGRRSKSAINVSYDRRRVDKIYVHDETDPTGFFMAVLTPRSEMYAGLSVAETKEAVWLEKTLKAGAKDSKAQARLEFHEHASPIVKKANRLTDEAKKGVSKTGRRKNITETRAVERDFERDAIAVPRAPRSSTNEVAAPPPNNLVTLRPIPVARTRGQAAPTMAMPQESPSDRPLTLAEKARLARVRMLKG